MLSRSWRSLVLLLTCPLASCSSQPNAKQALDEAIEAPFTARLGQVTIQMPRTEVFRRAVLHQVGERPTFVAFDLCPGGLEWRLPIECTPFRSVKGATGGIRVYLRSPQPWTRYHWLKERGSTPPPPPLPLRNLSLSPSTYRMGPQTPSEDYELSRLQSPIANQLSTTKVEWPVAACGLHFSGQTAVCSVGFRIRDMFVEAHWSWARSTVPNQREVWAMSVAIDQQIRNQTQIAER